MTSTDLYTYYHSVPSSKHVENGSSAGIIDPKTGAFKRGTTAFRSLISSAEGAEFPPEAGRYHLFVSYACPWAHRVLIVRKLKGLEAAIDFTAVHWHMSLETRWRFATAAEQKELPGENVRPNPLHPDITLLRDVYLRQDPSYTGGLSVPLLYDTRTQRIVSNESAEIIRMFYTEFDSILDDKFRGLDLFPQDLRAQIDETNEWTYHNLNNGVYKAGVAAKQEPYEEAVRGVFESLDRVEKDLERSGGPWYFGDRLTEADIRLYVTVVRFDPVYHQHFKCNIRDIRSGYPRIHRWLRKLYWEIPAFRETTEFEHIKWHYTRSHTMINPSSITPVGPVPDILPLNQEVRAVQKA